MNLDNLEKLVESTNSSINQAKAISDKIVYSYTHDLDVIMEEINDNIISSQNSSAVMIERYFLELTNIYYFIAPKCELLGLYEDLAKANARIKYNNAYGTKQLNETTGNKKPTVAELTVAAETASLDDSIVSNIYTRSFKIVKAKIEAANTMISTLSKLISSHDVERKLTGMVDL